jgi:PAS domain S-box-containing protein
LAESPAGLLSLRILHLEDDSADAALIQRALTKDGIHGAIVRVTSKREFIDAIETPCDLILADYALPGFDGVSAQRLARDRRPDVPFVFVSGTMGEEFAVDRLKDGATDYVLKQNLSRLPAAVRRALQEAAERRAVRAAQAEVTRLNGELESRVAERTAQLAAANAFLDSIIENLPDMIFVKEARSLRFVRLNRAAEQMLGLDREALLGRSDAEVFSSELADAFMAADRRVLGSGSVEDIAEEVVSTATRGTRLFHTKKIPVMNATSGEAEYLLGISRDITDQRAAEEAVRSARAEAERASRAKSEFLSRMSHDLRTPLNAILGFAQLLEMEALTTEQADNVRQILKGGRHLLGLINEVLDIARIEAGHLSLSSEPVGVADAANQVVELVKPLAQPREIAVVIADGVDPAVYVHADRQRLMQILMNLVGNAVKYNRDGGRVQLSWSLAGDRVRVSVADTGAGIPPEKLSLLFHPFERLGADQTPIEGTGLGLAVSKGLTEAMGGSIGVSSAIDQGSTFWIELPRTVPALSADSGASPTAMEREPSGSGTVLYVEDNRSNVRLLERLLARRGGVRLLTTASGEEAVAIAATDTPNLILLDLHLPDIGGEEVLRRLWSDPRTRPIPVAVLSADATVKQSRRLLAAGAVAYLTKPLDLKALLKLLDETLPAGASQVVR